MRRCRFAHAHTYTGKHWAHHISHHQRTQGPSLLNTFHRQPSPKLPPLSPPPSLLVIAGNERVWEPFKLVVKGSSFVEMFLVQGWEFGLTLTLLMTEFRVFILANNKWLYQTGNKPQNLRALKSISLTLSLLGDTLKRNSGTQHETIYVSRLKPLDIRLILQSLVYFTSVGAFKFCVKGGVCPWCNDFISESLGVKISRSLVHLASVKGSVSG